MLYWYIQMSNISASFSFSQTNCKAVQIDICWFNHICSDKPSSACHTYLEEIGQGSGIKMQTNILGGGLLISTFLEDCKIYQVTQKSKGAKGINRTLEKMCPLKIHPAHTPFANVTFTLNTKGAIHQNFGEIYSEYFKVSGKVDKVCFAPNCNATRTCKTNLKQSQYFPKVMKTPPKGSFQIRDICVAATKTSPIYHNAFFLWTWFNYNSNSWIEIRVRKSRRQTTHNPELKLAPYFFAFEYISLPFKYYNTSYLKEVIMLSLKSKGTRQKNIKPITLNTCVNNYFMGGYERIKWRSHITVSGLFRNRYISIPGNRHYLAMHFITQLTRNMSDAYQLKITHFRNYDQEIVYRLTHAEQLNMCSLNLDRKTIRLTCSSVSSQLYQTNYTHTHFSQNMSTFQQTHWNLETRHLISSTHKHREHISWEEGWHLCRSYNSHLPCFVSGEELENVIALMHKVDINQVKPVEGLYIGLHRQNASQVLYWWFCSICITRFVVHSVNMGLDKLQIVFSSQLSHPVEHRQKTKKPKHFWQSVRSSDSEATLT